MKYLHTMIRVSDLTKSLECYCTHLGLREIKRKENKVGRFTLIFLSAPDDEKAQIELTYNWDKENYTEGRNFGHIAYVVDDINDLCHKLYKAGISINRPPHDGRMAFIRSPDNISIELLQKGSPLEPKEPWISMKNTGHW